MTTISRCSPAFLGQWEWPGLEEARYISLLSCPVISTSEVFLQFINKATDSTLARVSDSLTSQNVGVQCFEAQHPTTQKKVIFVEPPGFDHHDKGWTMQKFCASSANGWTTQLVPHHVSCQVFADHST